MAELEIVDAHHHLWDLGGPLRYPWLSDGTHGSFLGDYGALRRDYLVEDYRRDARNQRVVKTVHVEAECDRSQQVAETRWLTEIHARRGLPNAIVAHAWFDTPDAERVLAAQRAFPLVRGIRSKPRTAPGPGEPLPPSAPGTMSDPRWRAGFALLECFGLSWDLRVPYWHLEDAARLVRDFPRIPVALNHTGFPWDRSPAGLARWREGMRALAACPQVHVKISELGLRDRPWTYEENRPIVLETIEIFGVDRCMMASNFPVAGLFAGFDLIFDSFARMLAHLPREDQERVFSRNAMRFYRIDA
jgi:predicted TIM-barrel fold metal-dependent hydrolase